ncbi:unnamed protein product [Musa acuminata subsp. malaccensis]|uniref:(wild Malaysian banana) hypothetical protein n=1 Tax=Musa acuminata subsp. malaccensis TaxID=214687 RepID=A0A804I4W3_MUSAM|nr:unnamed protein product [Musa acuminata subsp. malaccensis]
MDDETSVVFVMEREHRLAAAIYKQAFYEKGKLNCETNKLQNREREKLYLSNREKFHTDADKQYWKAIAKLITNEIANIEKRGKKEEQKPSQTKAWKAH